MVANRELCHRAILLDEGRIIANSESNAIISKYLNRNIQDDAILTQDMIEKAKISYSGTAHNMIKIREISLRDKDGIPRNKYYSDEEIEIVVEYEC